MGLLIAFKTSGDTLEILDVMIFDNVWDAHDEADRWCLACGGSIGIDVINLMVD